MANPSDDSSLNIDSKIYRWNGTGFVEFQAIPTQGAWDWESFSIGSDAYLAVANSNSGANVNIDSKIYRWNGIGFVEVQSIPTHYAWDWEFFVIGSDAYLAVANAYNMTTVNIDSKIYKMLDFSPTFTSMPVTSATQGTPYTYAVAAEDLNSGALTR